MKFAGDKTDVTALVRYAQDLEGQIERLRAELQWVYEKHGYAHIAALLGIDQQKGTDDGGLPTAADVRGILKP